MLETHAASRPVPSDSPVAAQPVTDESLLVAVTRGNQAALGLLYDRYGSAAMGLAYRIVADRRTAEEVVQDAFVAVWRRAGTYASARGTARTWLLGIVHHRAIDRLRGRGSVDDVDLETIAEKPGTADVWAEVDATLTRAAIASGLARLPGDQRAAIELGFFGGLTHVEIAEQLGEPLGTVKGRMRLGLKRLKELLSEGQARARPASVAFSIEPGV